MKRISIAVLLVTVVFAPSPAAFACQSCVKISLNSRALRIVSEPTLVNHITAVPGAKVRIRRAISLKAGQSPRQKLSCLAAREVGPVVWSAKTDRAGRVDLPKLAPGEYWLAINGKSAQAVYLVMLDSDVTAEKAVDLGADENGLVNGKCDVEPIEIYFK